MTRYLISLVCLLLFVIACNNQPEPPTQKPLETKPLMQDLGSAFYLHFKGFSEKDTFYLELIGRDTVLKGYFYAQTDQEIFLVNGSRYNDSFHLEITPWHDFGLMEDSMSVFMDLKWTSSQLTGTKWANNKPKRNCVIWPEDEGQVLAQPIVSEDSLMIDSGKSVIARNRFESLRFLHPDSSWINQQLYRLMQDSSFNGDMEAFMKNSAYTMPEDTSELEFMRERPYDEITEVEILYNRQNRLVLCVFNYLYSGGAHGNFDFQILNLDITKREVLGLPADRLAELPSLIEKGFRKKHGLTEKDSLNQLLFENHPQWVNNNYYLTEKGIGFIYNPYEIAPYVAGSLSVYVRLKKE
jgi:hypothetical protein